MNYKKIIEELEVWLLAENNKFGTSASMSIAEALCGERVTNGALQKIKELKELHK